MPCGVPILFRFLWKKTNFDKIMNEVAQRFGDSPYVATSEDMEHKNGEKYGF